MLQLLLLGNWLKGRNKVYYWILRNSKRIYAIIHSTERFFWQAKLFASYWCAGDKNPHLTKHATWSLPWKDMFNLMKTGRDESILAVYCNQSRNQLPVRAQGRRMPSLRQLKDTLWKGKKSKYVWKWKEISRSLQSTSERQRRGNKALFEMAALKMFGKEGYNFYQHVIKYCSSTKIC